MLVLCAPLTRTSGDDACFRGLSPLLRFLRKSASPSVRDISEETPEENGGCCKREEEKKSNRDVLSSMCHGVCVLRGEGGIFSSKSDCNKNVLITNKRAFIYFLFLSMARLRLNAIGMIICTTKTDSYFFLKKKNRVFDQWFFLEICS